MKLLIFQIAAIGAIHISTGVLLYRGRAISDAQIFKSDIVVFLLPAVIAFVGLFFLLSLNEQIFVNSKFRLLAIFGVASISVIFSFLVTLFIGMNLYGS